jgi:copper chaperone CopZ
VKTTVLLAGMRSEHCKRAVLTALTPVPGILSAEVTLGAVHVEHTGEATAAALRDAIEVTGYVVVNVAEERRALPIAPSHALELLEP